MIAQEVTVCRPDNSLQTTAYLLPEVGELGFDGTHTEVIVASEPRLVLSSLARLAQTFNGQLSERKELGHDCLIFALAADTGDDQAGRDFMSEYKVNLDGMPLPSQPTEPQSRPRDILLTSTKHQSDPDFLIGGRDAFHFSVRASVDGGEPLYVSKFGTIGSVMLHPFGSVSELYPWQHIYRTYSFARIEA
jgi:hypothetical protein